MMFPNFYSVLMILLLLSAVNRCDVRKQDSQLAAALTIQRDCDWRTCEISGSSLTCDGHERVCDMYRNQCVAVCKSGDCCKGVNCPAGTVCVPGLGRCGIPAGTACYDLGMDWWTARDVDVSPDSILDKPSLVTFELVNQQLTPVYIKSVYGKSIQIGISTIYCNEKRELRMGENSYCPTPCPQQGPVEEFDCGKPPATARVIPAGKSTEMYWSGQEEVGQWRSCNQQRPTYCVIPKTTLPGNYTVEICAHPTLKNGRVDPSVKHQWLDGVLSGNEICREVQFEYPAPDKVRILF